jgi:hypothetical protein
MERVKAIRRTNRYYVGLLYFQKFFKSGIAFRAIFSGQGLCFLRIGITNRTKCAADAFYSCCMTGSNVAASNYCETVWHSAILTGRIEKNILSSAKIQIFMYLCRLNQINRSEL